MRYSLFVILIVGLFFSSSCKKDYEIFESVQDYTKLDIGNYWVYESTQFGGLQIDSSTVMRDSIIRGNVYKVIEGHDFKHSWTILDVLRDSSNYIIDASGAVRFSTENFTDVLDENHILSGTDTFVSVTFKMKKESTAIEVPAGSFSDIYNYQGRLFYYSPQSSTNPKYDDKFYCKNIGLIKSVTNYAQGDEKLVKRLIRYHVN